MEPYLDTVTDGSHGRRMLRAHLGANEPRSAAAGAQASLRAELVDCSGADAERVGDLADRE